MSHISLQIDDEGSSISSCTGIVDTPQLDGEDAVFENMLLANGENNEGLHLLGRGLVSLAWERLEHAVTAAMTLLTIDTKSRVPKQVETDQCPARILIGTLRGAPKMVGSAYMLRNIFQMEHSCVVKSKKEILVAMVVYNMAFFLHLRGTDDNSTPWKQGHDLRRAFQLYEVVMKLSQSTIRLDSPVLKLAALNNMGHIHHVNQDYQGACDCWTQLSSTLSDLPPDFSLLDVRSMRLNIQLKGRIDSSEQPSKKSRSY